MHSYRVPLHVSRQDKTSDGNSDGKGSRQLAEKYGVGHTQVQNIMKRKCEIFDSYEDDANSSYSSIATTQHY